jgi:type IV fimbrial biogenesis protein FimT
MLKLRPARAAGFTLIEMVVTVTILGILAMLAMPSFITWIANNKVRTVGDALQNGLRLAQAESLRRSRQVVFSLTNSTAPQTSLTAAANGSNWSVNFVKSSTLDASDAASFIEAGVLASVAPGVQITGPAAVCFNSVGRLVANASTGVDGASCTVESAPSYDITLTGADRKLRVIVALGGQVHLCDSAKTLSASVPDGCPAS